MERDKRILLISSLTLVFLLIAASGFVWAISLDNEEFGFDYIYTTAICEGNNCRDYEIWCLDNEPIRIDPISGMVIFPADWKDTREQKGVCSR